MTATPILKFCQNCDSSYTTVEKNSKFCGHTCSATFNNRNRVKKYCLCIFCGTKMIGHRKLRNKYCTSECMEGDRVRELNAVITANSIPCGIKISSSLRNHLISLSGNSCSKCGWDKVNPYSGKCPLEIHHIDGDKLNNDLANLIVLCPSCHSLTPNYKSLNSSAQT